MSLIGGLLLLVVLFPLPWLVERVAHKCEWVIPIQRRGHYALKCVDCGKEEKS